MPTDSLLTESCRNETNIPSLVVKRARVGRRSENSYSAVTTSGDILNRKSRGWQKVGRTDNKSIRLVSGATVE